MRMSGEKARERDRAIGEEKEGGMSGLLTYCQFCAFADKGQLQALMRLLATFPYPFPQPARTSTLPYY